LIDRLVEVGLLSGKDDVHDPDVLAQATNEFVNRILRANRVIG
jgi:hypothetical protein